MTYTMRAGLTASVLATGAFAHSGVEDTRPADESTVSSVEVIELRFDDPMRVTALTLTGPGGTTEIERESGMDAATEVRALPPEGLPAGAYRVEWRGLSADGHPMQGAFGFTILD